MQIKNIAFWHVNDLGLERLEKSRRALGTLVVQEETPAINVAKAVDALGEQAHVVLLVNTDDKITGLFFPEEFRTKLQAIKNIQVDTITEVLTKLLEDPDEQARNFHHEFLNNTRPGVAWCAKGNHFSTDPCRAVHP
jgi:hypothetical protein